MGFWTKMDEGKFYILEEIYNRQTCAIFYFCSLLLPLTTMCTRNPNILTFYAHNCLKNAIIVPNLTRNFMVREPLISSFFSGTGALTYKFVIVQPAKVKGETTRPVSFAFFVVVVAPNKKGGSICFLFF